MEGVYAQVSMPLEEEEMCAKMERREGGGVGGTMSPLPLYAK